MPSTWARVPAIHTRRTGAVRDPEVAGSQRPSGSLLERLDRRPWASVLVALGFLAICAVSFAGAPR